MHRCWLPFTVNLKLEIHPSLYLNFTYITNRILYKCCLCIPPIIYPNMSNRKGYVGYNVLDLTIKLIKYIIYLTLLCWPAEGQTKSLVNILRGSCNTLPDYLLYLHTKLQCVRKFTNYSTMIGGNFRWENSKV